MPVGRPKKYNSPEEMQKVIDQYFRDCKGDILKDYSGKPIINKHGDVIIIGEKPPTVTGLAIALGFTNRQSLINYQNQDEFFDTITRAKMVCQDYAETRLYDRDGVNGAKFSLQNNFGWKERSETDVNANVNGNMNNTLALKNISTEELKEMLNKL